MKQETTKGELRLPGSALHLIRRAFEREADREAGARALRQAGFGTGDEIFEDYVAVANENPTGLEANRYWETMSQFLAHHGWGSVSHERIHPGLGLIRSEDWSESAYVTGSDEPGCEFSSGMLSRILEGTAGTEVAVVEVSCRGRGDDTCAFAFGSTEAVGRLREALRGGETLDAALKGF